MFKLAKFYMALALGTLLSPQSYGQDLSLKYEVGPLQKSEQSFKSLVGTESLLASLYLMKAEKLSFGEDSLPIGRSIKDAMLFKALAPSVVLIMTEDGLGSGSLISQDGRILTNKHVVGNAKTVGVFFKPLRDSKKISKDNLIIGEVIKIDDVADLAIVKVKYVPQGLTPFRLGTEEEIGIGLDVHAIGHPRGEYWTYTKGVISQYRSEFEWPGENDALHVANVIQTQTPINPGSSGGPLFLDSGVLIGVNSFKSSNSEGLNFAVSIDVVKEFLRRPNDRVVKTSVKKQKCEVKTLYQGRTEKNDANIEVYDSNCSGRKTIDFVYPDDVEASFMARFYRKNAEKADGVVFSKGRTDKWDVSYWDNNHDQTWSTVGLHPKGELIPSEYISRADYDKNKK